MNRLEVNTSMFMIIPCQKSAKDGAKVKDLFSNPQLNRVLCALMMGKFKTNLQSIHS